MSNINRKIRRAREGVERVVETKAGPDVIVTFADAWWRARTRDPERNELPEFAGAKGGARRITSRGRRRVLHAGTVRNVQWPAVAAAAEIRDRPPMAARPADMTRQVHRRLYREACKARGVPWRG